MSPDSLDIDARQPPFDQFTHIQRLSTDRSGRSPGTHARHLLYVARDKRTRAQVLIKMTTKPGLVYEHNLANEAASLTTINRELPDSRYFPFLGEHGRLRDGRIYLTISLFSEFPLATTIGPEPILDRTVTHLRTAIEIAKALTELHSLDIFHVDLNPMNILFRMERGNPVIRIVDFESSYEKRRHGAGETYNPPTTAGYSAPELTTQAPDARADVFSLGAVLYTLLAGYQWTWASDVSTAVKGDQTIDAELKSVVRQAVAADPKKRFASTAAFRDALRTHLDRIWPGRGW